MAVVNITANLAHTLSANLTANFSSQSFNHSSLIGTSVAIAALEVQALEAQALEAQAIAAAYQTETEALQVEANSAEIDSIIEKASKASAMASMDLGIRTFETTAHMEKRVENLKKQLQAIQDPHKISSLLAWFGQALVDGASESQAINPDGTLAIQSHYAKYRKAIMSCAEKLLINIPYKWTLMLYRNTSFVEKFSYAEAERADPNLILFKNGDPATTMQDCVASELYTMLDASLAPDMRTKIDTCLLSEAYLGSNINLKLFQSKLKALYEAEREKLACFRSMYPNSMPFTKEKIASDLKRARFYAEHSRSQQQYFIYQIEVLERRLGIINNFIYWGSGLTEANVIGDRECICVDADQGVELPCARLTCETIEVFDAMTPQRTLTFHSIYTKSRKCLAEIANPQDKIAGDIEGLEDAMMHRKGIVRRGNPPEYSSLKPSIEPLIKAFEEAATHELSTSKNSKCPFKRVA